RRKVTGTQHRLCTISTVNARDEPFPVDRTWTSMNPPHESADNLLHRAGRHTADTDPIETQEWLDALESVVRVAGEERAQALLRLLEEQAQQLGIVANVPPYSAYRNTIPREQQREYPGDLALQQRITSIMRLNAPAMVGRP